MAITLHHEDGHYLMAPHDIPAHLYDDHRAIPHVYRAREHDELLARYEEGQVDVEEAAAWLNLQHVEYTSGDEVAVYVHEKLHRLAEDVDGD